MGGSEFQGSGTIKVEDGWQYCSDAIKPSINLDTLFCCSMVLGVVKLSDTLSDQILACLVLHKGGHYFTIVVCC